MANRLSWQRTPAKSLVNADNTVAVKTYLQVSRNQTGTYLKFAATRPRISTTKLRWRLMREARYARTKTAQHSEREGGCEAAGHPSAHPLRVNQVAQ
jgi:hypothetical protein